ncbi:MAG: hypothetical protein PHP25_01530 [Candidatus Moranbacteria bacterium]|nr:hypothetical protein [Candidatus Moranbacteria bacterium]
MKTSKIVASLLIFCFCFPALAASESKLGFGAGSRQLSGKLNGKTKKYSLALDPYLYTTLFNLPNYTCNGYATLGDCYNAISIDRADQKTALQPLLDWITKKIKKSDDRVRVAASMVQNITYDDNKATGTEIVATGRGHGTRYPYETVYENSGICGEKAFLMAFLFKNLGYGTALITYVSGGSSHQIAGVKCASDYDVNDTGYCFIDPNYRHMITFGGSYETKTPYLIVPIADGKTFNAKNDWKDSRKWWTILNSIDAGTYTKKQAKDYKKLIKKYGM